MEVSFIIVNWNGKDYLNNCLKSIFKYTKDIEFEVIVVDNNSSDNSVDMVKSNFTKVKIVINKNNLGFAKANNLSLIHI